jgi:hypothetical protein
MDSLPERQVRAVKAVATWMTEVTRSPELDPVRREGVRRIVHMINLALDDPDGALEHYAPNPPPDSPSR